MRTKRKLSVAILALFVLPLLTACPQGQTCEVGQACWCEENPTHPDCTKPTPVITYVGSTLATAQVGIPYTASVKNATGADSISYMLTNISELPSGLSFDNGSISGTPLAKTTSAVTLQVRASATGFDPVNANFSLTVSEGELNYLGNNQLDGAINKPISISLATATGPTSGITYIKKSGDLPAGVTLSSAGLLSGTTTVTGTFTFVVTASAQQYASVDATFVLTITSQPVIRYTGNSGLSSLIGKPLSISIATATGATGITYVRKSGNLPTGVTLSSTGLLSGTPSVAGAQTFVVTASAPDCVPADATFTLTINNLPVLSYTGSTTLTGSISQPLSIDIGTASGTTGAITYTRKSGNLPAGVTLSSAGLLSGTPSAIGAQTFVVTASATDCTSADATFTLSILQPALTYSGSTLTEGRVSEGYVVFVNTATGISDAQKRLVKYTVGSGTNLPAGLVLEQNGILHGVLTTANTYSFKVAANLDGFSTAEATFTLKVNAAITPGTGLSLAVQTNDFPQNPAYVGEAYSHKGLSAVVNGRNDPKPIPYFKLAASSTMPAGFILLEDGTICNTYNSLPTVIGITSFTVELHALSVATTTATVAFEVKHPNLIFSSGTLPAATVGTAYSSAITGATTPDGTTPTITYSVHEESVTAGDVPAGLTLSSNGTLSGMPSKAVKQKSIAITASATGFTSVTAFFGIRVLSAFTNVSNGILEVEYINLDGMKGGGYSSAAEEEDMILQDTSSFGASNGYYIPFTHGEMTFSFNFKLSAAAASSKITLRVATEIGTITVRPQDYGVSINGVEMNYNPFTLTGSGQSQSNFVDIVLSGTANLIAGDNNISLTIKPNSLKPVSGGMTCGPIIDCIKLTSLGGATVNWQPYIYNLDRFTA